jgi:hypothetical protein
MENYPSPSNIQKNQEKRSRSINDGNASTTVPQNANASRAGVNNANLMPQVPGEEHKLLLESMLKLGTKRCPGDLRFR